MGRRARRGGVKDKGRKRGVMQVVSCFKGMLACWWSPAVVGYLLAAEGSCTFWQVSPEQTGPFAFALENQKSQKTKKLRTGF